MEFAEWAAPIVPVVKSDKSSVRICGDFKLTVNKASKLDQYPIPRIEDLFATLNVGKTFTKLDMRQAYQQLPLAKESKAYLVINTHRGLYQYNRLPFGVSSAPGIFQRVMESLLNGIPSLSPICHNSCHSILIQLKNITTGLCSHGIQEKVLECLLPLSGI